MIEWTTPTQPILVRGADLTACDVRVTLAQAGVRYDLAPDGMTYDADSGTLLVVRLTQEQTGALAPGAARLQVNAIDSAGYRAATKIYRVSIGQNLLEEVMTNE